MMDAIRRILKWICTLCLLTLIQEKTANIYGAAICTPPCVLFSNTTDIVAFDYKTSATHSVVSGLTRAVALDVHFKKGYIFWSDVREQNIKRSGIDGSGMTTIINNIGVCDGLAVQWRTSELYWTDTTHDTISISDLAGNNQRSLLSSGLDEPRDIALDPDNRLMFWTDWGATPKIEKATLRGTQRVAIVTANLRWPNGIELDTGKKRIYWVDGGVDRIESVDYHGNNRVLLKSVRGYHPFGVALIPPFLFSTDWAFALYGLSLIHKLDATTGYYVESSYSVRGMPMGIVAYDNSRQPPVSNPCARNNGGCSHFCVVKTSGYGCACPVGLTTKSDGRTCEEKIQKFLLFTDSGDKSTNIISLDVDYIFTRKLFSHLRNQRPIALDYDPVEDRIYWTDVAQGSIKSAFSNATSLKTLFQCNVKVPDGLAIDRVGRNIYWTDTGTDRIEVARLDGTRRKLLIEDGLDEPRAIVLDERNGMMYWTDWGSNAKIEQAAMDGSSRRSIVTRNLAWPNGLTIDQTTNLLYWADAKLDKIEASDLNGVNRRTILSSASNIHPFGLTVYQGMLYWTDWNTRSITRFDLKSGNKDMIITGLRRPMDIHLYNASLTVSGSHPCATNNGLCSDLCLLKPNGGYQCACPTGIALQPDGKNCDNDMFYKMSSDKFLLFAEAYSAQIYKVPLAVPDTPCIPLEINTNISRPVAVDYDPIEGKVYWTDVTLEQVSRAYPNGSDLEVIAQRNVITPDGVAVDWIGRNIYWSDAGTNKIEVSRLDGSFRTSLVTANLHKPRAVVLDIEARKMYWSDWGYSPKIEQANMDGTARTTLVSSGLSWVNSLALDFKKRLLYWCDALFEKIERVDLQGNNRKLILDLSSGNGHHPFGLALYKDVLFWTDWTTESVHRYNMTSSLSDVLIYGMGKPMEIHIHDHKTFASGPTSCSHLNGGCSHICLPNPNGHQCFCPEGVQLKPGDSFTCQGVNRCPKLSAPAHGTLVPCSNVPGEICQFSCDKGYLLSGTSRRTCKSDGTWTGLQAQCTVVTCPALPTPSNGVRQRCTGTTTEPYNTICQFSCHSGFNGLGPTLRRCLENGSWSGKNFVCQAITCPPLITPPKAVLLTPSCTSSYGSICSYSCQTGYTSSTGNVTRRCLASAQWSGSVISCKDAQPPSFGATCPASPLLAYAERDKFSAMVNWTEPVAVDNSGLSPIMMSNYHSPQRFSYGSHVITYTAVDQSGNKASCNITVEIIVINCTTLAVDPVGPLRMGNCNHHYGSKCNFSCVSGYRLNGSSTVTCVAPGNRPPGFWDNRVPACQIINCPALSIPPRAILLTAPCVTTYGSNCSFSCQTGYLSSRGNVTRKCLSSGQWSGNNIICTDVDPPSFGLTCPGIPLIAYAERDKFSALVNWTEPVAIDNSGVTPTVTSNYQSPQRFSQGTHVITFTAVDQSGNKATCNITVQVLVINCTSLTVNRKGPLRMSSCGNHYGSKCNFSCAIGHTLNGSSTVTCVAPRNRPPGVWNNPMPVCQVLTCPALVTPSKAILLTVPCTSIYGSNCSYSCQNGYASLTGKVTRTCLSSGEWSGNDINCTDIHAPTFVVSCPPDPLIAYAERDKFSALVNWTEPVATDNSGVAPTVTSNYKSPQRFSQGRHVIKYTAVDKSGNNATCNFTVNVIVINCSSLMVDNGGSLRMSSCGHHYGSKCNFSCAIGHRLNGSSMITCIASGNRPPGFWDNPMPVCQVITCPALVTPSNAILLTVPCTSTYGSNCTFSCQIGYASLTGKVTRTCLSSGQWSGNDINCTDVHSPTFGGSCPVGPLIAYAERDNFSALVNWTEPVAVDNSGVAPTVTSNYQSPQRFSQGAHVITYTAVDKSGNKATCNFTVNVIVINCSSLIVDPGGPLRISSCGHHYGSKCNFSCAIGHRLNGSSTVTCVAPGNRPPGFWNNPMPVCQVIKCPPLVIPPNARLLTYPCINAYGSNCYYSCQSGYTSSTGNVTRTCLASGQWSGFDINCTDVQAPTFAKTCPGKRLQAYAERDKFSALVNWTLPVATDNSGVTPTVTSNFQPPIRFSQGTHLIIYTAVDQSGNKATCTFTFAVIVINCTTLVADPNGPLRMSSCGNNFGSKCNFSCAIGHRLNGSSTLTCVAPGNKPPGFWDNSIPVCQVISCPTLIIPPKAILLTVPCTSTYGSNCSFSCQTGYASLTGNITRTCLASGQWSGTDINCTDIRPPTFGVTCPSGPLIAYAERDKLSALVNWTEPVAIDNSGMVPTMTSNYQAPQRFSQGSHVIIYTAVDQSANNATCTFTIVVIVINCTTLMVDPVGPLHMSSCENHYGSKCYFSCVIGHRLNGSSTLTCVAPGNKPPGIWDKPAPVCEVISCPTLIIPPKATLLTVSCTSTYGSNCSFSCQAGYASLTGNVTRTCLASGHWSGNDINCTDIRPPTFGVTCPSGPLIAYAERDKLSALVNWTEPVAIDNSGMVPTMTSNYQAPQRFSQGSHVITYTAVDQSANNATCTFTIVVIVINCTTLVVNPGGPLHISSCGNHYGSKCNFSCGIGHRLNGSSTLTCVAPTNKPPGLWDNSTPVCEVISCPALIIPPKAILLTVPCTSTYGSNCSFSCQTGYASLTGNVTRTCLASGQWSGSKINCTDIRPPTFGVTCPSGPLLAHAERDKFSALVNWTEPVAIDNSGVAPSVTSNYQSPQRFNQGTHLIIYTAVDQSGNKATCTFTVTVIVITCPSLTVDSGGPLRMSSCGHHYGSKCNFTCLVGHRLNGSSTVTCDAPRNRPPGFWDKPVPVCQAIRCPSLPGPPNGKKVGCADPLSERYGTVCSFSCNVGYNLTGSFRRQCLESETWSGLPSSCHMVNCSALVPPSNGVVSPSSCLSRSTYGQTCRFSCQTAGYILKGTSVRVCGGDGEWTGNNNTICKDNTPPSFNNTCPGNIVFYVPKCSSRAVVSWNEPMATDNSGHVFITYPVVRPPANLSIGLYNVQYSVADDEGNRANCSFIVQVTRKTCPALQPPLYGVITSLSCGSSFGSQASLSCNKGYRLVGSRVRSCEEDGGWSGNATTCHIITCLPLVIPPKVILLTVPCTSTYGSNCSFSCQTGYTSLTGNVTRTCTGQWSGNDINCTDIHPPTFGASCPAGPLLTYAERDKFSALVNWADPVASDNTGVSPTVTSNYQSPQRFSQGSHVITYTAVDKSGNKATCIFTIKVLVINCTTLVVDPGGALRMGNCGSHYGSKCNFSCAIGHRLNGSSTLTCVALGNKPSGFWDSPTPVCEVIRCPSLPAPANGVKKGCADPLSERYGTVCSFSCNVGYNLTGSSRRQCLENEKWSGLLSTCQVINCSALAPLMNGAVSPSSCLSRSSFGQTCSFSCVTNGYILEGTPTRVCGDEGKWTGTNDTVCRDNTPPSFNNTCPTNKVFYVPKCLSSAVFSWNEPMATDNSGHVIISYPAVRPPANLSIGLYNVHYLAADGEGNRANCSFIVQVARTSCPALQQPNYGFIASLSCGVFFGSQASISCNKGYRLVGSSVRSCEKDGRWSGNKTTCKIVKCPAIKAPFHGTVYPATCKIPFGVNYQTNCIFTCNVTNAYQLEGPTSVSCLENGSWSADVSKVICKDIQPPSIQCPPNKEVPTTAGKSYALVTWQVPVPTDNSNEPLNLSGLLPPQKLNVGLTNIRYKVMDFVGLSQSCVFTIHVKDLESPKIDPCPGDIKIISPVRLHMLILPAVNVTDNVGVDHFTTNLQNGSEVTRGEYNIIYTASDKAGNKAQCRFIITIADSPCKELPSPKNGAKACETWLDELICTVHCNKGYGFANIPNKVYYCSASGKWWNANGGIPESDEPQLPDCSKTYKPKSAWFEGKYHYLTKKCGGKKMNAEIADKFIKLLMRTTLGIRPGTCEGNSQCNIKNVRVDCGETALRKRDVTGDKQSATLSLTVSFSLRIPLSSYSNISLDFNQTLQQIINEVLAALDKEDMTLNISGIIIQTDPSKPPEFHFTRLVCDEGQVQSGGTCVNCPLGYFFNGTSCQACAVDQYQDQEAQTSCITCPSGTSTSGRQASKRQQDCQELPHTSGSRKQGFSRPILISVIAAGSIILIVLITVTIYCARKHFGSQRIKTAYSDSSPLEFSNMCYYSDWLELHQQELMESSEA